MSDDKTIREEFEQILMAQKVFRLSWPRVSKAF